MRCKTGVCFLTAALLSGSVGALFAQSSASYSIPRSTIDGGGVRGASATYQLRGTIGQPDAAKADSAGYALTGGFHKRTETVIQPDAVFANGFE